MDMEGLLGRRYYRVDDAEYIKQGLLNGLVRDSVCESTRKLCESFEALEPFTAEDTADRVSLT